MPNKGRKPKISYSKLAEDLASLIFESYLLIKKIKRK